MARALEHLPEISDAFEKGDISYSKVRAMTRVATPANESVLVNIARHGTASHIEKLVRKYRWTQRSDAAKESQWQHEFRNAYCFYDADGAFVLHARLPRELGALVQKALERAGDVVRPPGEPGRFGERMDVETFRQSPAQAKQADALRLMAETYLAHHGEETGARSSADRVQVVVHIDREILSEASAAEADGPRLCELEDGPALALDTARRLACDATVVGLVEGQNGEPLNIGRKTRSIPAPIARALKARDGGCRCPGCDRTRFTEGHHIIHWADGGETDLKNLVTLCSFHHQLVHEGGFGLTGTGDGELVFTRPDGRRVEENGARRGNVALPGHPSYASADGELHIRTLNREAGQKIDASTSRCRWLGETMDYSMAIEGMYCLEQHARRVAGAAGASTIVE